MIAPGGPRFDEPSERTLGNVLRTQALHRPETRFVVAEGVSWTFADVDQRADGLARGLVDLGVGPGDTVAIYSGNRADLVPLVFAINRVGAVWVPINTDERGSWLRRTLQDSRATVVVVDSAVVGRVAEVMEGLSMAHLVLIGESDAPITLEERPEGVALHVLDALASSSTRLPDFDVTYGDTSAVLWTSGTTGRQRG